MNIAWGAYPPRITTLRSTKVVSIKIRAGHDDLLLLKLNNEDARRLVDAILAMDTPPAGDARREEGGG